MRALPLACALAFLTASGALAETVRMAVTTSFHNSGLSDVLLPEIAADTGIEIQLLVVGTGQALKLGQAGDVDAILVHSKAAEEAFVAAGYGPHRTEIMYNDFVVIGPADDPAGVNQTRTANDALGAIAAAEAPFVSRGDDSGTHRKEQSLWDVVPQGGWYRAAGAGMGATLNIASGMGAYVLSDRASWLNFGNKGGLAIVFEGDPQLFNQYAFLPVSTARHAHVKGDSVAILEKWLIGEAAKQTINNYRLNGVQLFTFNAQTEVK